MQSPPSDSALGSIVYVSTAVREFGDDELEALLLGSRDYNRRSLVTGVMLYCHGNIMQCIEGPRQGLDAVFNRIKASRRHTDIFELMNQPIDQRVFESWEMGLARPSKSEMLALSTANWTGLAGGGGMQLSEGMALLRTFWRTNRQ